MLRVIYRCIEAKRLMIYIKLYQSKDIYLKGGDCNIYKHSQLPVLQGYNDNYLLSSTLRYGDEAWSHHQTWTRNPFMGQFTAMHDLSSTRTPAGRTSDSRIFGRSNSSPAIPKYSMNTWNHGQGLGRHSLHDHEPWLDHTRPQPGGHNKFIKSVNLEKRMALKRKSASLDSELDLKLSLKLPRSGDDELEGKLGDGERCSRRSSCLALSLNLPSTWVKGGSNVDTDSKQNARRTSTLDLTL
ncbi:hypothetical protein Ancab_032250 [Ancistrocladus abbreviatus]